LANKVLRYIYNEQGKRVGWELVDDANLITGKQDTLVSGTNIKTINGNSILGSGDVAVEVGGNDKIKIQQTIIFTYNL
jgi:hypothetical protein